MEHESAHMNGDGTTEDIVLYFADVCPDSDAMHDGEVDDELSHMRVHIQELLMLESETGVFISLENLQRFNDEMAELYPSDFELYDDEEDACVMSASKEAEKEPGADAAEDGAAYGACVREDGRLHDAE